MELTRDPTPQYTAIERYLKGLTIYRGGKKILKSAYSIEDAHTFAKLLANYNWSHVSDTTLILITTALLIVSKKFGNDLIEGANIDNNNIKNLFIAMAKGNGATAKQYVNCLNALFTTIITNAGINYRKAESVWTKYKNHIGQITTWKYSVDAVVDNVKPILKLSLNSYLYNAFKNNLLLVEGEEQSANEEFKNIAKELFDNGSSIDVGKTKVRLHIFEQGTTDTPQLTSKHIDYVKIKHNGIATYYMYADGMFNPEKFLYSGNDGDPTPTIGFNSNSLRILMRRNKLNSVKKLQNFLVKHIESLFKKMDKDLNSVIDSVRKDLKSNKKELHLRIRLVDSNDFISSEYKSGRDIDVPENIKIKYQPRREDDPNDLVVILDRSQLATLYYYPYFGSNQLKITIVETIQALLDVISNNGGNTKTGYTSSDPILEGKQYTYGNADDTDSETDSDFWEENFITDEEAEELLDLKRQNREEIMSKIKEHEFVKELLQYDAVKKQLVEDGYTSADKLFESLEPYKVYLEILGLILIAKYDGVPPDKKEEFQNEADAFVSDMEKLDIPLA